MVLGAGLGSNRNIAISSDIVHTTLSTQISVSSSQIFTFVQNTLTQFQERVVDDSAQNAAKILYC